MRSSRTLAIAVSSFALASCNPFHREPVTEVKRDVNVNSRWRASLVTPATLVGAVQMRGSASMQPANDRSNTQLTLNLSNATPGGRHPWQVHRGQCGSDEGVFGRADSYAPIAVNDDGQGEASATVAESTPTTGRFFVVVSASAANSETIVACGNLAPPTQ